MSPAHWSDTSISTENPQPGRSRSEPPNDAPQRLAEFSAGGVVVRGDQVAVIVPVKRDARGNRVRGLPKGHPEGDESAEEAATREVAEECGVTAELIEKLGEVQYFYERRGRRVSKRVAFFLFEYRSGDLADHDHEIEEACWISMEQAALALTYEGERSMVRRALSRIAPDR
jgi:8-oxo-dGTP pyrophosphatase MutT (NUDIX family)